MQSHRFATDLLFIVCLSSSCQEHHCSGFAPLAPAIGKSSVPSCLREGLTGQSAGTGQQKKTSPQGFSLPTNLSCIWILSSGKSSA